MTLQNRVAPDGSLHAVSARGTMLGNRGGRFHEDDKTLGKRRWATHHWICCELHYKDKHHEPMGQGYTSLFFLDEVTALAAGHRPCFFCRHKEAKAFLGGEKSDDFDRRVHQERLAGTIANERVEIGMEIPDGAMFESEGMFFAKRGSKALHWSFAGFTNAQKIMGTMNAKLLTPPSIVVILQSGYKPRWHSTALQWDNT